MATAPKILIVDDNDMMRTLLRGILRSENYEIIGEAKNGMLALTSLRGPNPTLSCSTS